MATGHLQQLTTPDRRVAPADAALGAGLAIVAVLSGFYIDANRPDTIEPTKWWHWLLIVTPALLVVIRRLAPMPVVLAATPVQAAIWIVGLPEVLLPMIVLLYSAAADDNDRSAHAAIASSIVLTAVTAVGVRIADDVSLYQLPLIALTCVTAIALGLHARRARVHAASLATTVTETRLEAERERASAVADERAHIARELHDIIGHTLSVIAVRAEAADRVATQKPEAAGEAVSAIAVAARSALSDTRRVLAGLRTSSDVELAPPPDLSAARDMVDNLVTAGVDVALIEHGCTDNPPPAVVAGGACRIIQESLTNAVKHGPPGTRIEVTINCAAHQLDVQISNTTAPGQSMADANGRGSGLAGMAERAEVLGGDFGTELDAGRFIVRAVLPNEPTPGRSPSSPEPEPEPAENP